jgi:hypothetical protein
MGNVSWTFRVKDEVTHRVMEEKYVLKTIKQMKAN